MYEIERIARECGCTDLICEVYDQSKHAITFYGNEGFCVYGTVETLKYRVLKLIKKL